MSDILELTEFERSIYRADSEGRPMLMGKRWKPIYGEVFGEKVIIGYIRSSGGFTEMVDREGNPVLVDEIGIEPSLISPLDVIGPGIITRKIGLSARRVVVGKGASVATVATRKIAAALDKMKIAAARLMSRKAAQMVIGPRGRIPRATLEAAMKSQGSTTAVMTRLTAKPQVGRALSVAAGDNAAALSTAARSAGAIYTAKIPNALMYQLESIGLVSSKLTQMGNVVGKEYRFLEAASEFIVPFFK